MMIQISFSARWLQKCSGPHIRPVYLLPCVLGELKTVFYSVCMVESMPFGGGQQQGDTRAARDWLFHCVDLEQAPVFLELLNTLCSLFLSEKENVKEHSLAPLQPSPALIHDSASGNWQAMSCYPFKKSKHRLPCCVGRWSSSQVRKQWVWAGAGLVLQGAGAKSPMPLAFPVCGENCCPLSQLCPAAPGYGP